MKNDSQEGQRSITVWLSARTPLERIGLGTITVAGAAIAAAVVFPHAAGAAGGGALASLGALLLGRSFRQ